MPPPAAPQPRTETNYYAMIEAKGNDSPQGDVAFLNALGKNWVFQLDEYVAKKFMKDKAAFLDKVEAKAETPNKKGAHVK